MSCINCCINLCEVLVCDGQASITIPNTTAQISGEYTLVLEFLNTAVVYKQQFTAGSPIIFDVNDLNEDYAYVKSYILNPNNEVVLIYDNGSIYGCFDFETRAIYNNAAPIPVTTTTTTIQPTTTTTSTSTSTTTSTSTSTTTLPICTEYNITDRFDGASSVIKYNRCSDNLEIIENIGDGLYSVVCAKTGTVTLVSGDVTIISGNAC